MSLQDGIIDSRGTATNISLQMFTVLLMHALQLLIIGESGCSCCIYLIRVGLTTKSLVMCLTGFTALTTGELNNSLLTHEGRYAV